LGDIRVELRDVYVAYQGVERPALKGVSLSIGGGKLVVVTGPNGSGKTTLLETCLGLLKPFKGVAKLLGVPTVSGDVRRARRFCSYLPQNFMRGPHESHTVKHVIAMGLLSVKGSVSALAPDDMRRIKAVAKLLEISDLLNKPIGRLSGGQQQRAFLARALIREPLVLLLDEPLSSIDPEGRERVRSLIDDYTRERGATTVMVSHVVDGGLSKVADAVITLSSGELVSVVGTTC
jgi:ABC-type Mn2+/Zn2+ transport system ATPase subunit